MSTELLFVLRPTPEKKTMRQETAFFNATTATTVGRSVQCHNHSDHRSPVCFLSPVCVCAESFVMSYNHSNRRDAPYSRHSTDHHQRHGGNRGDGGGRAGASGRNFPSHRGGDPRRVASHPTPPPPPQRNNYRPPPMAMYHNNNNNNGTTSASGRPDAVVPLRLRPTPQKSYQEMTQEEFRKWVHDGLLGIKNCHMNSKLDFDIYLPAEIPSTVCADKNAATLANAVFYGAFACVHRITRLETFARCLFVWPLTRLTFVHRVQRNLQKLQCAFRRWC